MIGTHILIGIGEGVITALAISAVMASRSDLVYGYKGVTQVLEMRVKERKNNISFFSLDLFSL
jgi:hypothetical protein